MAENMFHNWNAQDLSALLHDSGMNVDHMQLDNIDRLRELASEVFVTDGQWNNLLASTSVEENYRKSSKRLSSLSNISDDLEQTMNNWNETLAEACELFKTTNTKNVQELKNLEINRRDDIICLRDRINRPRLTILCFGNIKGTHALINSFVETMLLPTSKTKSGIILTKLCHNETPGLSISNSSSDLNTVSEAADFHRFPNKPADAYSHFISCNKNLTPFLQLEYEYPLPTLGKNIVMQIADIPDDTDALTRPVIESIETCDGFVCTVNGSLTTGSVEILQELIRLGRSPASIIFALVQKKQLTNNSTLMDVENLRKILSGISSEFERSEIVSIEPVAAYKTLTNFKIYTKEHMAFMEKFSFFLSSLVVLQLDTISEHLINILKMLHDFVTIAKYQITRITQQYQENEAEPLIPEDHLEQDNHRLKLKVHEFLIEKLTASKDGILTRLQSAAFQAGFSSIIKSIPFEESIGKRFMANQEVKRNTARKELTQHSIYLQHCFESCALEVMAEQIKSLALSMTECFSYFFCNDLCLSPGKREVLFQRLNTIYLPHVISYHEQILRNMLRSIRSDLHKFPRFFLSHMVIHLPRQMSSIFDILVERNQPTHQRENQWEKFRNEFAEKYHNEIISLGKVQSSKRKTNSIDHIQDHSEDTMHVIKDVCLGTKEEKEEKMAMLDEIIRLSTMCDVDLEKTIMGLRSRLNRVSALSPNLWSLSIDMLDLGSLRENLLYGKKDAIIQAKLKLTPTWSPIHVYVSRLSGNYCALTVSKQTLSSHTIIHQNILYCYGAFRKRKNIYIVNECWTQSLKQLLDKSNDLHLEQSLQIAIELTDICDKMFNMVNVEKLTLENIVIGSDDHVKVDLLDYGYQPSVNESDEAYQTKKQIDIIRSLGMVFDRLFTNRLSDTHLGQKLNSLVKRCLGRHESNHNHPLSLKQICYILKFRQLYLQYKSEKFHHLSVHKRKTYALLSIDGGGSRGIISARILQHLEQSIGRPLWETFHFGAGVSTGGLLILSTLLRRTPAQNLTSMYLDLCGKIFGSRLLPTSEYSVKKLEQELLIHFGTTKMIRSNPSVPQVFVVTKRDFEAEPHLLRNYDIPNDQIAFKGETGWLCSEAARATSAAPTYFPAFKRNGIQYTDGAMGFDNPVLILFKEVLYLLSSSNNNNDEDEDDAIQFIRDIDCIVSIGTGKMDGLAPPGRRRKTGISRIFETIQLAVECVTDFENAHYQMQMLAKACGNIPYFRFNPKLPERMPLDIRVRSDLENLVTITDAYLQESAYGVPKEIERLKTVLCG